MAHYTKSDNILEQPLVPIELLHECADKNSYDKLFSMIKSLKKAYLTEWHPDRNPIVPDYIETVLSMFDEASDKDLLEYECQKAIYNYKNGYTHSNVVENSPNWSVFKKLLANQQGIIIFDEAQNIVNTLCVDENMFIGMRILSENTVELSYGQALSDGPSTSKTPIGVSYECFENKYWSEISVYENQSKKDERFIDLSKIDDKFSVVGWIDSKINPSNRSQASDLDQLVSSDIKTPEQMFIEPEYAWFIKSMETDPIHFTELQDKKLVLFNRMNEQVALMPKIDVYKS